MHERRVPIGVLAIVPMAISFGLYAFTTQEEVPDPAAAPDATATVELPVTAEATAFPDYWETAVAKVTQTAEAVLPTPVPTAAVSHGPLHDGAWVRVNAGVGDCLNARNQPVLDGDFVIVNFCLPHGFEGMLSGNGMQREGHWWWSSPVPDGSRRTGSSTWAMSIFARAPSRRSPAASPSFAATTYG